MRKIESNIDHKHKGSYSFLRFAIFGLWLILLTGVFIVAKILMVYI
ncbi:MAG: hypothetical protein PHP52_04275 [Bacteroidales bacterium]|nr:hypothetical protein [Bacteroidales bacterium]MDD4216940.1 hypothetical protein [Bacteroidales bacterium]MDY0140729.1 hypothetical protein [Bacteroidales bacterium]